MTLRQSKSYIHVQLPTSCISSVKKTFGRLLQTVFGIIPESLKKVVLGTSFDTSPA